MMKICVPFLEGGPESARGQPAEARKILHAAFGRLPAGGALLGWNPPPALLEACAEECGRTQAELDPERIRKDREALAAAAPDGLVLSWDLRHIPVERPEMAGRVSRRSVKT
ncbi:MAG: hypothetical protein JW748_06150 [Anaerolineales bacterium]|nr:hypothetical protein [Anaerolineales bacterium]